MIVGGISVNPILAIRPNYTPPRPSQHKMTANPTLPLLYNQVSQTQNSHFIWLTWLTWLTCHLQLATCLLPLAPLPCPPISKQVNFPPIMSSIKTPLSSASLRPCASYFKREKLHERTIRNRPCLHRNGPPHCLGNGRYC